MSLWVDKYRPKDLQKLDFHKEQAASLKRLIQQGDFPHLLMVGPSGAGKKTRIMCLLKELYGPGVERLRMEQMNFTTPSNKKLEIMTISSNYHIEVNPSDVGIYDRVVVMDLIKNVAQSQQLDSKGQKEFKVVVLTDVDQMSIDAQHALRRTMEKYIANCRLILCCNSTSRVIPAIKSRCLNIKVPAPTIDEIVSILQNTCKREGLTVPVELAKRIAEKSNRNLRRSLLMLEACKVQQYPFTSNQNITEPDWSLFIRMLEACKVQQYPFTSNQNITEPDWSLFIRNMAKLIIQEQSLERISKIREDLYELIVHDIPGDIIFEVLVDELTQNCDFELKLQIVEQAAMYEHRMRQGNKEIFHLEAFIVKFMCMYKKYLEDALGNSM
ncbi:Replication factor C C-terminal domain [Popillia japonica]|uniref:Replication factor C subunit 3 n=1 Tax=Popillia japonica TaxID=7064 RepID=A0AAW1MNI4_POPJA